MRVIFQNIRGLNKIGRMASLATAIGANQLDFISVIETKKKEQVGNYFRSLEGSVKFAWNYLQVIGTAEDILVGLNADMVITTLVRCYRFPSTLWCMIKGLVLSGRWLQFMCQHIRMRNKSLYESDHIMCSWQGPTLIGDILVCLDSIVMKVMVGLTNTRQMISMDG